MPEQTITLGWGYPTPNIIVVYFVTCKWLLSYRTGVFRSFYLYLQGIMSILKFATSAFKLFSLSESCAPVKS